MKVLTLAPMKTIAGHTLLLLASTLAAGFALGRFAFPQPPPPAGKDPPVPDAASSALTESGKAVAPFTGTVEDLLRTAQGIRRHHALAETLHDILSPLPASQLVEFTAAFPWSVNPIWQETAVCQVILESWLAKDAAAAGEWAALLPEKCRKGSIPAFLASAAVADPGKAVVWVQQIDIYGGGALPEIAGELAATDPQAALKLLQSDADASDEDRYDKLFEKWAESDPAAALAAALALPKDDARTSAVSIVFGQWSVSDRPAAWAAALVQPQGELRDAAVREVLETWAYQDPKAALAAAHHLPKAQQRAAVMTVLGCWAGKDPAAVAAAAVTLPPAERRELNKEIGNAWMNRDPLAALTWAKALSEKEGGGEITGGILSAMAKTDGPAAAAAWASLPPGKRDNGLDGIMSEWSSRDFDGALQWARSLKHPRDRGNAISYCMTNADFNQRDRISAVLDELPPGKFRQSAISTLTAQQMDKDIEATFKFLSSVSPEERSGAMAGYGMLSALAEGDVRQTLALMAETPGLHPTSHAWQEVVEKLASEDPAAALQWAASLSRADARKWSFDSVFTAWARTDGPEAMRQARMLSDPELQTELANRVLYEWAEQDPDAVLQWAKTAPAAERVEAVLRGALGKAESDPAAGAAIIDSLLAEGSTASWIPAMVAERWFDADMDAACDWTLRLPPGGVQTEALSRIVGTWALSDAIAASKWVADLPPGNGRDAAALSLVRGISESDPESALVWAAGINNASNRSDSIGAITQHLNTMEPVASRTVVEQSPLSAAEKQGILELLSGE